MKSTNKNSINNKTNVNNITTINNFSTTLKKDCSTYKNYYVNIFNRKTEKPSNYIKSSKEKKPKVKKDIKKKESLKKKSH